MTGAVTASDLVGSAWFGIKDEAGLTASPLRIDQSLMLEIKYSD